MGTSLKDQLLKAGLVDKKQARKVEHEKRISRRRKQGKNPVAPVNRTREEQVVQDLRNRELNRQRAEESRLREQQAQVKQLIEHSRLPRDERGEPYHFVEQNKIKRIFVSEEMTDQLSRGQLAIVKLGGAYEVVPAKVARQIASRAPEALLVFHDKL
ncbi:DUF2058 domain-containing protein [Desulfurivibrio sp. C05AmB]|uniref:DUF2058 domain-containing protein n=1 Tax=Desulfurivibrio sp. C05AmB TaxID=3374371 RepID=UPI00376F1359